MNLPADWLWIVIGALGTFAATQLWPAVRGWIDADFKARRERERKSVADLQVEHAQALAATQAKHAQTLEDLTRTAGQREERYVAAMEQIAKALDGLHALVGKIETVLDLMGRHDTGRTFEVQEMRRDLNESLGRIERAVSLTPGNRRGPRTEPRP